MDLFLVKVISYILLFLSIGSLWLKDRKYAIFIYIIAVFAAFYSDIITIYGFIVVVIIHAVCWGYYQTNTPQWAKIILAILILLLAAGSCLHVLPGFNNFLLYEQIKISEHSAPYTMYLNFDKAAVGFSMIYFRENLLTKLSHWRSMFAQLYKIVIVCVFCLGALALYSGYVAFEPKISFIIVVWAINNLLIVSVMEEVVYRGLIQQQIARVLHQPTLVILITSCLFAITHYPGGSDFVIYSFIAGLFYSYSFYRTGKIEAAVFTHFSLNLAHILLFTYPFLAV